MKTFAPHHYRHLLAWTLSLSLCAVMVAGTSVVAAPAGYTELDPYTPTPKAPPRPYRAASASSGSTTTTDSKGDTGDSPTAVPQSRRQTRSYVFDRESFKGASEAIHGVLTPRATFLVQEKSCKIIVQDDAVNIATADAIAVALQPSVQGIPPTSASYSKVTTRVPSTAGNDPGAGTSGVFLPRSNSSASTSDTGQSGSGSQASTTQDARNARVEILVEMQENGSSAGAPATRQSPGSVPQLKPGSGPLAIVPANNAPASSQVSAPRQQVLVMDSGSTMRFQVNRSPQMEFFRRVAAETGYPTDKTGPAWKRVGTQIAVKPVAQQDGTIAVNVYPEIVVEVDGGVQQVMPLEDLGTSVTLAEGQAVSLSLFPAESDAFNDAFFGRKLSSSTMRTLSGTVTLRARVLEDNPETSTAGTSPQSQPRVPLAPNTVQDPGDSQALQTEDSGTYMYVGTEMPYVDYGAYDYGYYSPLYYSSYNFCRDYRLCRNIVGPICRDVLPNCDKYGHGNHNKYSGYKNNSYNGGTTSGYGTYTSGTGSGYSAVNSGYNRNQVVLQRDYNNNTYGNGSSYNNTQRYNSGQASVYRNPGYAHTRPNSPATSYDATKRVSSVPAATPTYQTRNTQVPAIQANPSRTTYYNTYANPYRQPNTVNPYRQYSPQSVNPYRSNIQQGAQPRYYPSR